MHFVFVFELLMSCVSASNTELIHLCSNADGIGSKRQVVPRNVYGIFSIVSYCCSPLVVPVVRVRLAMVTLIFSSCFLSSPHFFLTAFSPSLCHTRTPTQSIFCCFSRIYTLHESSLIRSKGVLL